jgi:preprotein translocase subunit SecA
VSLEDDLMRLFGSERISKVMDRLGMKEGEVIQSGMITNSIERAQRKVEENNFGIRKRLLEYDNEMNRQREVVYKRRRNALYGERLAVDIANMMLETCENIVVEYQDTRDFEGFKLEVIRILSLDTAITHEEFLKSKSEILGEQLYKEAEAFYRRKSEHIAEVALPIIRQVYDAPGNTYINMMIPITDGIKATQIMVNMKRAAETGGREVVTAMEQSTTLAMIDDAWKEHLREMDELKQSVQNAVYEQKDPLLIYKIESFKLFQQMLGTVGKEITAFLMKGNLPTQDPNATQQAPAPRVALNVPKKQPAPQLKLSRSDAPPASLREPSANDSDTIIKQQPVIADPKIGRNDPCPCGSGKKYKACHGLTAEN